MIYDTVFFVKILTFNMNYVMFLLLCLLLVPQPGGVMRVVNILGDMLLALALAALTISLIHQCGEYWINQIIATTQQQIDRPAPKREAPVVLHIA